MYKYTLDDIPPSNNKYIGRTNRWEYQNVKKMWADLIRYKCNPKPPAPIRKCNLHIHYHFADHRRRDPDNYSGKMLLDGLVRANIIVDDSFTCIDLILTADYGNKQKQTVITIEEE